MYLVIDASDEQILRLATSSDGSTWQEHEQPCTAAHAVLPGIEQTLLQLGSSVTQLAGVGVLIGKGRFTATRVAVTIANTFGFALHIPVIALTSAELSDFRKQFATTPPGQYVLASYSAPARIGGQMAE